MENSRNARAGQATKGLVSSKRGGQDQLIKPGQQRHGNRREGSSNKQAREGRPTPPRVKMQNMPRSRGGSGWQRSNLNAENDFSSELNNESSIDDEGAEMYSVFSPGSKKQNLNHLLNFHHYVPQPRERFGTPETFGRNSRMTSSCSKYDKRQFLQANCQFLVKPSTVPYSTNIAFVDTLVDWEPIEQIYLTTFEDLQCPICLFPPVACKITKCGHIYCWPCILHYLALSDKPWRRCPICHEAVTVKDLKSAVGKPVHFAKNSDVVTFDLMKRDRDSLVVVKSDLSASANVPLAHEVADLYSKIFLAEVRTVNDIIEREKLELLAEKRDQGPDCPESVFIEQALALLEERKADFLRDIPPPQEETEGRSEGESFVYFFQASDGQHMYLHPINCKMLEATYGHVKNAPKSITGRILQKESRSMNEGFRKRFKCFGHLPLTCEVDFVEIEFLDPVIPEEIIQIFQSNLKQRESKRMHKEHAENVRARKIEEINKKQLGYRFESEAVPINIDSVEQFPICVVETEGARGGAKEGLSFAKVMKTPEQSLWPTLPSSSGMQQFSGPSAPKVSPAAVVPKVGSYDEDDDLEEFDRLKLDTLSIGGAIAEAIEKKAGGASASHKHEKGKKKGKKGVTLFATGIAFSGSK